MQFHDIVRKLGEFGYFQKRLYFLLCIVSTMSAFHAMISVFLLATPKHRCAIPGYSNDTYEIQSNYHLHLINMTIPPPNDDDTVDYDQCEIYVRQDGDKVKREPCDSWVYASDVFESTFAKEQNIVCSERLKKSHAQTVYFAGKLVGSLGIGTLSDIIGRKKALYLSVLILLGSSLGNAWAPEFISFCILRFFVGLAGTGSFITSFVIGLYVHATAKVIYGREKLRKKEKPGMELVGPSKRLWAGMVIEFFFAIGLVILAGVGFWLRHWKYIDIACSVPVAICLTYWWIIPESPRWLASQGRYEEANKILHRAAKLNKVSLPEKVLDKDTFEERPVGRIWHLFTSRVLLIRCLIIFFNWMVVNMAYYGLSLNSGNLGGNYYFNFFLSGLVEFPAYGLCLLLLDRIGRKILNATCMVIGGVACVCTIFTILYAEESLQPLTITLAMLGKLGVAASYAVIFLWSAEIFPTVVRNAGMGASSCCARIGGMAAPYIADLSNFVPGNFGRALPLLIFGAASIAAGLLSLYLPETLDQDLPETIEDGINFKGKRIFKPRNNYEMKEAYSNKAYTNDNEKKFYSNKAYTNDNEKKF